MPPLPFDRQAILLAPLTRAMSLIEIGPSHRPLAPKSDGWRTTVVDHATRAELIAKYTGHPVDVDRTEDVDIVWSGGDLAERFPAEALGSFDAILASHVLEHMPDPAGFLRAALRLLRPSGAVILALPDKRYTFDFFGPATSTADWLTASRVAARTHSQRAAFNHVAYAVSNADQITWLSGTRLDSLRFVHKLDEAAVHFGVASDNGQAANYNDYHAWRFTPSGFALLLLEVCAVCDLDLHVASCTPTIGQEFFVVLKRGRPVFTDTESFNAERLRLLKASVLEMREAIDLLLAAKPASRGRAWLGRGRRFARRAATWRLWKNLAVRSPRG